MQLLWTFVWLILITLTYTDAIDAELSGNPTISQNVREFLNINPSFSANRRRRCESPDQRTACHYMKHLYGKYTGQLPDDVILRTLMAEKGAKQTSTFKFTTDVMSPDEFIMEAKLFYRVKSAVGKKLRRQFDRHQNITGAFAIVEWSDDVENVTADDINGDWLTFDVAQLLRESGGTKMLKFTFVTNWRVKSTRKVRLDPPFIMIKSVENLNRGGSDRMKRSKRSVESGGYYKYRVDTEKISLDAMTDVEESTTTPAALTTTTSATAEYSEALDKVFNYIREGANVLNLHKASRKARRRNHRMQHGLLSRIFGNRTRKSCSMEDMYLDFADIGWDYYVVSPMGIDMGICVGSCDFPVLPQDRPSNHAILLSLMSRMGFANPKTHQPISKPCCVPRGYKKQTLVFYDSDNSLKMETFHRMAVKSCGCL